MNTIFLIVAIAVITIVLVWLIDKFLPKKIKPVLIIALWAVIFFMGYMIFNLINDDIKFNKLKDQRYKDVVYKLVDIRNAQVAHKEVTGTYATNFNELVRFVDTAKVPVTQRRDSTVVDEERSRQFGITMMKTKVIIDTLNYYSVKDSIFQGSNRYKKMMYSGVEGQPKLKFDMKVDSLDGIPVFEAKLEKKKILHDQDENLVLIELEEKSVDGIRGDAIKVGSTEKITTNGNWPKNYLATEKK